MSQNAQPLSAAEKAVLQDLLNRASLTNEIQEPSTPGSFSVIDPNEHGGAMSDASKRCGHSQDDDVNSKRPYSMVPGSGELLSAPALLGRTPHGKPIFLPSGVNDLESWGRTVIQFGKFIQKRGSEGISYAELFDGRASDEEKRSYVKWVIHQIDSAKGHLLDLGLYLCVRTDDCARGDQLPLIPGTGAVRRFK
eukprot:s154_g89.t1